MRSRWVRWIIWTILACLAIPVLGLLILFLKNPEGAAILLAVLVSPLFVNSKPPPQFEKDIAGMWLKWDEASRKITAHLQEQFPAGTAEGALKSALTEQGFPPLPPPPTNCVPKGQDVPVGKVYTPCYEINHVLEYHWGGGVCRETISVRWKTDGGETITDVNAGYHAACL